MKRTIAITSSDPNLKKFVDSIEAVDQNYHDRRKFIHKQLDDLTDHTLSEIIKVEKEMTEYLRKNKTLPEGFDPEKHHVHLSADDSENIFMCDCQGAKNDFKDFKKRIESLLK